MIEWVKNIYVIISENLFFLFKNVFIIYLLVLCYKSGISKLWSAGQSWPSKISNLEITLKN